MPFLPLFTGIRHLAHVLRVPPTKACLLCATPTGMDLYTGHACRHLLSAVPWISEDPLFWQCLEKGAAKRDVECEPDLDRVEVGRPMGWFRSLPGRIFISRSTSATSAPPVHVLNNFFVWQLFSR